MAVPNKYNFKEWDTYYLKEFRENFEEFSLTNHQINNLHLYYQVIEELHRRFPTDKTYQLKYWYFSEENPKGNYCDFIYFMKENGGENL